MGYYELNIVSGLKKLALVYSERPYAAYSNVRICSIILIGVEKIPKIQRV